MRARSRSLAVALLALTAATLPTPQASSVDGDLADQPPGTVLRSEPLDRDLWIPGTTRRAFRLTYVSKDAHGRRTPTTGTVFLPKGDPPRGGWPVISWAHGTSGLADHCAPSRIGPTLPERDWPYLATWMRQGYAVVASDYAGLGSRGLHAYLHTRATARNIVDMVKAARSFTADQLPRELRLADRWVVLGQSQGGGGAIATASYATEYGGKALDFRGGVGTGTPAYIELLVSLPGPGVLPVDASPALTSYLLYILAGMREVHPELDIDSALTEKGKDLVALAERTCILPLEQAVAGTPMGDLFTKPLASLPGFPETARDYLGMPETSFERPIFLGHGMLDTDVPMATTTAYVATLLANGADVTFRTYPTDHSGTMDASLDDTLPFVRRLFRRG